MPNASAVGPEVGRGKITQYLKDWNDGDDKALCELVAHVYDELRQEAKWRLQRESSEQTLVPTGLVNEMMVRLMESPSMLIENRRQFFWFAGELMRRILVERARAKNRQKRGLGEKPLALDVIGDPLATPMDADLILAIDEAMTHLEKIDARQIRIVELRFFAGLEISEIAASMDVSESTVKREWRMAKHWLARRLQKSGKEEFSDG